MSKSHLNSLKKFVSNEPAELIAEYSHIPPKPIRKAVTIPHLRILKRFVSLGLDSLIPSRVKKFSLQAETRAA